MSAQPKTRDSAVVDPSCADAIRADAWHKTHLDLDQLRQLADDWDGDGAVAPPQATLLAAEQVLDYLQQHGASAPMTLGAGPSGSVVIEWHQGEQYFEVEVSSTQQIEWVAGRSGKLCATGDALDESLLENIRKLQ